MKCFGLHIQTSFWAEFILHNKTTKLCLLALASISVPSKKQFCSFMYLFSIRSLMIHRKQPLWYPSYSGRNNWLFESPVCYHRQATWSWYSLEEPLQSVGNGMFSGRRNKSWPSVSAGVVFTPVVEWSRVQTVHNWICDPHQMIFRNEIFKRK